MNFTWKNGRSLATATTSAGDNISYQYNKDGIRTSKTVNGTTTKYQLEDNDIVRETTGDDNIWYLYDETMELLGLNINGVSYYYEKNLQGDVIGLVDTQGNTVVTYSYDAWGNVTKITGDKTLAKQNPFRYRSYYYDEELGLYYLQSRYYDSQVGRFINADDVNVMATMQKGLKGSNLFEYCENNPVNKEDSTGYCSKPKKDKKKGWKLRRITIIFTKDFLRDLVTASGSAAAALIGAGLGTLIGGAGCTVGSIIGAAFGWVVCGSWARKHIKKDVSISRCLYLPKLKKYTYKLY